MQKELSEDMMVLETICPVCNGSGGGHDRQERWFCSYCRGAGYIPTDLGERVLALMRHNFRSRLREATDE